MIKHFFITKEDTKSFEKSKERIKLCIDSFLQTYILHELLASDEKERKRKLYAYDPKPTAEIFSLNNLISIDISNLSDRIYMPHTYLENSRIVFFNKNYAIFSRLSDSYDDECKKEIEILTDKNWSESDFLDEQILRKGIETSSKFYDYLKKRFNADHHLTELITYYENKKIFLSRACP